MTAKIDLTVKHLCVLAHAFSFMETNWPSLREQRVARSILDEPVLKMRKKHIEVTSNLNLFNQKKRINFSLKYHEAHYLGEYLALAYPMMISEYDKNVLRMITHKLNQILV